MVGRKKRNVEKHYTITNKPLTFRVKRSLPTHTLERIEALFRECEERGMTPTDVLNDMLVWFVEYQALKQQVRPATSVQPQASTNPQTIEEVMKADLPQGEKEQLIIEIASKMAKESGRKIKNAPAAAEDEEINLFDMAEETSTFLKR